MEKGSAASVTPKGKGKTGSPPAGKKGMKGAPPGDGKGKGGKGSILPPKGSGKGKGGSKGKGGKGGKSAGKGAPKAKLAGLVNPTDFATTLDENTMGIVTGLVGSTFSFEFGKEKTQKFAKILDNGKYTITDPSGKVMERQMYAVPTAEGGFELTDGPNEGAYKLANMSDEWTITWSNGTRELQWTYSAEAGAEGAYEEDPALAGA